MQSLNPGFSEVRLEPIDITKGLRYWPGYIRYDEKEIDNNNLIIHHYKVTSESSYKNYDVTITVRNSRVVAAKCTCPRYYEASSCKHIAAVIIQRKEEILKKSQTKEQVSDSILSLFYNEDNKNKIKKELKLSVSLSFNNHEKGPTSLEPTIKIGDTKLYSLNSKASKFFDVYDGYLKELNFGKDLTYTKDDYFFSEANEKIIEFLKLIKVTNESSYYTRNHLFTMDENETAKFLKLIENQPFKVEDKFTFNHINRENPYEISLTKINDKYHFTIKEPQGLINLSNKYAIYNDEFYEIPSAISKLIIVMNDEGLSELVFDDKNLDKFSKGILKSVKDNITLDDTVKDTIIIAKKPTVKLFFDFDYDHITCAIKLTYKDREINYFDNTPDILRDIDYENTIITSLIQNKFTLDNNEVSLEDIDDIGAFLENGLQELTNEYEIFTSQKLKNTHIQKDTHITSTFSIGQDNIMSYKFDLDGLNNDEIVNILSELKKKKHYYKLKNGDLINLDENKDLQELNNLIDTMELGSGGLKNGSGVVPKYRAIYLDSLKSTYGIIKTNNLFDKLINNFNSYKNAKLSISSRDKKILRDYQLLGVQWLYNIYKCGFGSILADEMGLGKSIQLIYFIKEVLKEKPDSKILIIAPTSLVYNWKKEFDKFGSELKYQVLAENRAKRKDLLNNIKDINILITTYGLIREDKEIYEEMNFEVIAIDEAQNIKNNMAQMTKIIKSLKGNAKFALTGTPLENSVLELWSIFDFIMPGYLSNALSFSHKYAIKEIDEDSVKQLDNLKKQIKPFILRRKKKDVVKELPDKLENNIFIELTKEQKKIYVAELDKTKKELDDLIAEEGFTKARFKILQLLTKLRQICIDPSIVYENYTGGSAKISELIPMIKDIISNNHKILLFSTYKTAIDIMNRELTNNNISSYVIDGSVSSKKRMELVEKFNVDDTNVFLITLKAGGTGLNLTGADVVIHLDLWWNPQVENQATDRAHRIGQKNTVEVIKLICKGTIEERILELQNKKKALSDTLIEGDERDQNIISKLSEKDIKRLLSMDNTDDE